MMSSLGHIFGVLERDIQQPVHQSRFMEARCRHQVLADQPSVESLIRSMGDQSRRTLVQRDRLTLAMLCEWKTSRHPFWSSILLVAYQPMLKHLRSRIYEKQIPCDELNQMVITGFLTVLESLRVKPGLTYLPSRLFCRTKRWVFHEIQAIMRDKNAICNPTTLDNVHSTSTPWNTNSENAPLAPSDVADAICLLLDLLDKTTLDGEAIDLLTHTMICRKTLSASLGRLYPEARGLDEQGRKRLYGRIKRRHSRILQRVRERFADHRGMNPEK